ncbi:MULTISPECIES: LysR family transcriptional regulator [unclassified Janthinobacterium]|uniref:LysR family transcriptional regulator n=1 Tax=unclassified Janthinobacterium TaxID=2610881 RepID=UPI00160A0B43|nr:MULTISPECIES: LysR family transcriptional regulator [unclassified Janthinobacterium]MBB5607235.1 LysR family transcriptional regulator for bpeEF and oprC [Janthinobacterium sp. S3T4]MBB5612960.1 LysR family transcriptional regulator for bpeEF and oprC [Janthinobacterium sp. S3M3]
MDRLESMQVFCAVVEAGGFSKAAQRLGISTSSVTNQVAALEKHFGVRLLQRTTRSMSLTAEGLHCHAQARQLLADMAVLEASLQQAGQRPSGSLRADMPSSISRNIVAPALPRFIAAYPEIDLRMTVSDRLVDMVEEGIDVMLRIGEPQDCFLVARSLFKMEYLCCASPEFLARHGQPQTPQELEQFACLNFLYPKSRQVRPWLFQDGQGTEPYAHTPASKLSFDHIESMIAAAQAGCGIVQALSVSVMQPLREGSLLPLLQPYRTAGPDVWALFHPRQLRAAKVQVFVDFLAQLFQEQG